MSADVDDVQRARARADEVGSREASRRLGEHEACAIDQAAAPHAPLAGEGGQGEHRADAAAAILVALEPVAYADGGGGDGRVPLGELRDLPLRHAAGARGLAQAAPL